MRPYVLMMLNGFIVCDRGEYWNRASAKDTSLCRTIARFSYSIQSPLSFLAIMANLGFSHPSILSSGLQENSPWRPGLVLVICLHLQCLASTSVYGLLHCIKICSHIWHPCRLLASLQSISTPRPAAPPSHPRIHWITRIWKPHMVFTICQTLSYASFTYLFFFLHYIQEINTIMILKFKMKKRRHGMVQYLAQDHTAIKWGNLERIQEADL